jgi:hypothetical protein
MGASSAPLTDLLETYSQCLEISRDYVAQNVAAPDSDLDLDALQHFIEVRADLFASAEASLASLNSSAARPEDELTRRVVNILESLAETESRLSSFLEDHLEQMRETINQMKRYQPVFQHYGQLGGHIHPSRITRRE